MNKEYKLDLIRDHMNIINNISMFFPVTPISQEKLISLLKNKVITSKYLNRTKEDIETEIDKYSVNSSKINQRSLTTQIKKFDESMAVPEICDEVIYGLLERIYQDKKQPNHIEYVTSTEHSIPTSLQRFLAYKGWNNTYINNFFDRGCAGALPAIHNALNLPYATDIFCAEIFSPYVDLIAQNLAQKPNPQLVIEGTLFSDASVLCSTIPQKNFKKAKSNGLELLAYNEIIIPDTHKGIHFRSSTDKLNLSVLPYVPAKIKEYVLDFAKEICKKAHINFEKEKKSLVYAVHPGGPKILTNIQEEFNLPLSYFQNSIDLLYNYGNFSSPTCPILLKEILENPAIKKEQKILTIAAGPGITINGLVLNKI